MKFGKRIRSNKGKQELGFVLIVTLVLMVMLVILVTGLLSISSVTLRSSKVDSDLSIARYNAQLGLQMALSQLQETMGPDQRVTAPADLKFAGTDSSKWVGVYGNESVADYSQSPSAIPSEPYKPVLLNWLVSGNENVSFSSSVSSGSFGSITSPPSSIDFEPTDNVSGLDGSIGGITIAGQKAALLVGDGSVENPSGSSNYVAAPIVSIMDQATSSETGGYAYWVGDEGMKARIDLRDNFRKQTTSSDIDEAKAASFISSQRNGIEMMSRDDTANNQIGDDYDPENADIEKLITTGEFPLLSANLIPVAKSRYHDITSYSKSVIADSYAGGLKQEMGALIYGNEGPDDSDPVFTPENSSEFGIPRWGHIRSWANLTAPLSTPPPVLSASVVRPYTRTQTKFGPVLVLATFAMGVEVDQEAANAIRIVFYPALILWNPYTVAIPATDYEAGFRYIPGSPGNDALRVVMKSNHPTDPERTLGTGFLSGGTPELSAGNGFFRFRVVGEEIPAGESHIYLAQRPSAGMYSPGVTTLTRAEDSNIGYLERKVTTDTSYAFDPDSFNYVIPPGTDPNNFEPESELEVRLDCDLAREQGMASGNRFEVILTSPGELEDGYDQTTPVYQALTDMNFGVDTYDVPRGRDPHDVYDPNGNASTVDILRLFSAGSPSSGSGPQYITRSTIMMEARGNPSARWPQVGAMGQTGGSNAVRWIAGQNPIAPFIKRTANEEQLGGGAFSHGSVISGVVSNRGRLMLGNSRVDSYLAGIGGSPATPAGNGGARQATLIDILPDTIPLMSLGQLQHAQLDPYGFGSTYTFGNGAANVNIPRADQFISGEVAQPANSPTTYSDNLYDMPWHTNRAIWDRYFVSTAESDLTQQDIDDNVPLLNGRMEYLTANGRRPSEASLRPTSSDAFLEAAANLMVKGGFNLNSTSVDAWKAILTGTNQLTVPSTLAHPEYSSEPLNVMMPRFSRDVRLVDTVDADGLTNMWSSDTNRRNNLYRGNRELVLFREVGNDSEEIEDAQDRLNEVVNELAEKIVEEIRLRGPFLSVSDFVNRKLDNTDEGIRGTLQAALDKMENYPVNPQDSFGTLNGGYNDGGCYVSKNVITGWEEEHFLGTPTSERRSVANSKAAMSPKYLTQGDILTTIGSSLSARSDTFLIRSYGEALDSGGNVISRAWCEAVVQRLPDYVDREEEAWTAPSDLTLSSNRRLGRRFSVVSFRWLSEGEI
ncbi:MAG: hypothetical protein NWT08_04815 [Akkermansiaceae bacterium]|jgi:type II secretory pathway pseudopilin PulG|nr:hypothetical protein [Akkermansiaceae bacterium]MDP4646478.1 hypothetical protein [Akkermansiaceae bacterium]MDP4780086.1 hypothetical protein [Akkermansiaceae bacterium]MDP4896372.1 hypothetical protein [Akkermansiaceae bacterium]MDP4995687.1 hypothetical protein [Akkermansiaceae bacterium]